MSPPGGSAALLMTFHRRNSHSIWPLGTVTSTVLPQVRYTSVIDKLSMRLQAIIIILSDLLFS
jgi:hypothetical protein